MPFNKNKIATGAALVLPVLSALVLSGCTSEKTGAAITNDDTDEKLNTAPYGDSDSGSDILINASAADATQLKVSSGCIGCGRCTRIDPEHFTMDYSARTATVKTTDNLGSTALDNAIQNCPARAILRS